jgi:hypothetical protein
MRTQAVSIASRFYVDKDKGWMGTTELFQAILGMGVYGSTVAALGGSAGGDTGGSIWIK